jgi:hypothetical protein
MKRNEPVGDLRRTGGRFVDSSSVRARYTNPRLEECTPEIRANCEWIASYLLELAQEGNLEPALAAILDALDESMDHVEAQARAEAERIYEAIFENHIEAQERRLRREGCDPYFWG